MTVRIDSDFATPQKTGDVLGVSSQRVRELAKLVEASKKARRSQGISWIAPAAVRNRAASARVSRKKRANASASKTSRGSRKRSGHNGKGTKRGKKSKARR